MENCFWERENEREGEGEGERLLMPRVRKDQLYMYDNVSMVVTENNFLMSWIHVLCISGAKGIFSF